MQKHEGKWIYQFCDISVTAESSLLYFK